MSTPPRTSALRREEPHEALAFERERTGARSTVRPRSLLVPLGPDQPLDVPAKNPSTVSAGEEHFPQIGPGVARYTRTGRRRRPWQRRRARES